MKSRREVVKMSLFTATSFGAGFASSLGLRWYSYGSINAHDPKFLIQQVLSSAYHVGSSALWSMTVAEQFFLKLGAWGVLESYLRVSGGKISLDTVIGCLSAHYQPHLDASKSGKKFLDSLVCEVLAVNLLTSVLNSDLIKADLPAARAIQTLNMPSDKLRNPSNVQQVLSSLDDEQRLYVYMYGPLDVSNLILESITLSRLPNDVAMFVEETPRLLDIRGHFARK